MPGWLPANTDAEFIGADMSFVVTEEIEQYALENTQPESSLLLELERQHNPVSWPHRLSLIQINLSHACGWTSSFSIVSFLED